MKAIAYEENPKDPVMSAGPVEQSVFSPVMKISRSSTTSARRPLPSQG
jgi:hypothetical protein